MTEAAAVEKPSTSTVITSETAHKFYADKLGLKDDDSKPADAKPAVAVGDDTEVPEPEKAKEGPKGVAKALAKLTEARDAARADAAALRARIEALEKAAPKETSKDSDEKPDQGKYTDAFKYAEDLARWAAREERRKVLAEESEKKAKEQEISLSKAWQKKVAEAKKGIEDWDEIMADNPVEVSNLVRDAILESDIGPQIMYHLANNPDIADRWKELTAKGQLIAFGRLEAKLEKAEEAPVVGKIIETPTAKKAPEPIKPLRGGDSQPDIPVSANGDFTGSFSQYRTLRKQGKIK